MDISFLGLSHAPWIQALPKVAPNPMSEASVKSLRSEALITCGSGRRDLQLHSGRKEYHHWISNLASLLNVMWWCCLLTVLLRSIRRLRKVLPGLTTLATKDRQPMRDSSSVFVLVRRANQEGNIAIVSAYLSGVTSIVISLEFNVIPRYGRAYTGPIILSSARGMPRS